MADVIHLEKDVSPPDEICMVVARDVTGGFYVVSSEAGPHTVAPQSDVPISETDRMAAINRAQTYADQHGIKTIYVVT